MKKLAKILLLLIGIQCIGMALVYNGIIYVNRMQQFATQVNNKNCVWIYLTTDAYKAATVGQNEIDWQGNRYDILERIKSGNTIHLKVVQDKKEISVLGFLKGSFSNNSNTDQNNSKSFNYCLSKYVPITYNICFLPTHKRYTHYCNFLQFNTACMAVNSPPPRHGIVAPQA